MAIFPQSPWFTGANAPSRIEADVDQLEVVGEIPRAIDGGFFCGLPPRST
jgi:hypothetical protein